ncbi:tripartite tricarboxylate transporter TctB family protein [Alkalibacter saccharofermentans]|uniref:Tripartite tricarboxylate transporter TctB family protein n=1 Tax=Alkalibacter saccharofermentans DSM 14828 TaxID=1120975 RepID=A0A1M4WFS9_9FIRM|nr:tripartite tricarboxylate transporter TctB family protein [Alkalibacter saccharofermentans]SHE80109.1 Tripartite tricarboxylate transporter TctB family protein [Alkalibacter saccharofermentans DSM 14828]
MISIIGNTSSLFLNSSIIDMANRHLFFPELVTKVLGVLFILLLITNSKKIFKTIRNIKTRDKEINIFKNWKLFFGNLALLFGYVFLLDWLGFIIATALYMFLTILLFYGTTSKKIILMALAVSGTTVSAIYIIFGTVFRITLP